jgi:glycosyltransferase involved in cell wall biosynthesis
MGRLLKDKGVFEYVEAARRLRPRHPDARFVVLGALDPNPSSVRPEDIAAWQREGIVEHAPETKDVRPFLRDCTVFVLPSYREGTPRSVLEAMATGRAAVTTDAPGCRETVVDGDNGFLVPVRDPAALATAMERFLLDPTLAARMGARGRALVEERFDVDRVVATMIDGMRL